MEATAIVFLLLVAAFVVSASAGGAYGVNPMVTKPATSYEIKENEVSKPIAIQGLIYCKSGLKLVPLQGAIARITCLARNHNGLELAPFSISSCPTDVKGYFLAKLSPQSTKHLKNARWELKECKAFLEKSPSKNCKVPLDINKGITGAHIFPSSSHRFLKNENLYSVEPFFYTTDEPRSVSDNRGY